MHNGNKVELDKEELTAAQAPKHLSPVAPEGKRAASQLHARPANKGRVVDVPACVVLVISLLVGTVLALCIPPGAGLDESTHIARTYQLAHGQLHASFVGYSSFYPTDSAAEKSNASLYGGQVDRALWELAERNKISFQLDGDQYAFPLWTDAKAYADWEVGSMGDVQAAFSNTAVNTPLVYLPFIVGLWAVRPFVPSAYWTIVAMRLFGVAVYAVGCFLCVRRMPFAKWAATALLVAPNVMATVSTVNADLVSDLACAWLIAVFLRLLATSGDATPGSGLPGGAPSGGVSHKNWVGLFVGTAVLGMVKMSYAPLVVLPMLLLVARPDYRNRKAVIGVAASAAICICLCLGWYKYAVSGVNTGAMWRPDVVPSSQLHMVLADPASLLSACFATRGISIFQLGRIDLMVPRALWDVTLWLAAVPLVLALLVRERYELALAGASRVVAAGIATLLACAGIRVLTMFAMYLSFTPLGAPAVEGVQNRYFVPVGLLVGAFVAACVGGLEQRVALLRGGRAAARLLRAVTLLSMVSVQAEFMADVARTTFVF